MIRIDIDRFQEFGSFLSWCQYGTASLIWQLNSPKNLSISTIRNWPLRRLSSPQIKTVQQQTTEFFKSLRLDDQP